MRDKRIDEYITSAYSRLLDYSTYHCTKQGLVDEEVDVLNEVLVDVLRKDEDFILALINSKKPDGWCEMDYFLLDMIRTYTMSDTAPYRHKYKNKFYSDENTTDLSRLNIIDEEDESPDRAAVIFSQMEEIRSTLDKLGLSPKAKEIFSWKFFAGESFTDWKGKESKSELYDTYNKVFDMVRSEITGETITLF